MSFLYLRFLVASTRQAFFAAFACLSAIQANRIMLFMLCVLCGIGNCHFLYTAFICSVVINFSDLQTVQRAPVLVTLCTRLPSP
jgi:hypothetical protein